MEADDAILNACNETELLTIAHTQGLGRLKRGLPRDLLLDFVIGRKNPSEEHLADTRFTRKLLEQFLAKHWEQVSSQLPGCDGKCTTFPCSEGRHALCFSPNKEAAIAR